MSDVFVLQKPEKTQWRCTCFIYSNITLFIHHMETEVLMRGFHSISFLSVGHSKCYFKRHFKTVKYY